MRWSGGPLIQSFRLRLVVWYMISTTFIVLACVAAMLFLLHRQAEVYVDAKLRTELATLMERWRKGVEVPELDGGRLAITFEGESVVDVWRYDRAEQTYVDPARIRGADGAIESGWREKSAVAESANGSILIRVARPASLTAVAWQEFRLVLVGCTLGLLLVCGISALATSRAFGFVRTATERMRLTDPRAPVLSWPVSSGANEVTELSKAINDMLDRQQRARLKEAHFATQAAHELRTPLAALRCVGEMALQREGSMEQTRAAISAMLEEGEHMRRLIDGLLLLARAEGDLLPRASTPVPLDAVLRRCVRSLQPLAEEKGQTLHVKYQGSFLADVDETLLSQAILNLVHNALRHTPTGTFIETSVRSNRDSIYIVIADNGMGFKNQGQSAVVRNAGGEGEDRGLGLGLSIAQALVRSQGGRMVVRSKLGRGTLVQLQFPAKLQAPAAAAVPTEQPLPGPSPRAQPSVH
jgi:signal transduction histidine kinase